MVRLFFPLGLIPVLLSGQLRTVSGATLDQLFIIASGSTNGGCDAYFDQNTKEGTLDKWLEELDYSTEVAFNAFENYKTDDRIKSALFTFFGIPIVQTPDAQEQAAIDHISGVYQRLVPKNDYLLNILNFILPYPKSILVY